jgi:hypothetical protein
MNTTSQISAILRRVLERPSRDVVGMANDLLSACQEQALQLDGQADCLRIRPLAGGSEEAIDNPFRKSVFRAIVARLAALCNERNPGSVSPYGGQGRLSVGANPSALIDVTFSNTSDEQWFKLTPLAGQREAG